MARNYPACQWNFTPLFLKASADHMNTTDAEAEDILVEELGPCEYYAFVYITDPYVYSLIACYCAIMPIGFFGNLAVIFTVSTVDELKTVVNLLLAALACSDLLLTITLPWTLLRNISYDFNPGNSLCKMVPPIQGTAVMSAITTMVLIAVERYRAILDPFGNRILNTPKRIRMCVALIWLLSFCFQIPQPVVLQVGTFQDSVVVLTGAISYNVTVRVCAESWSSAQSLAYSYAILFVYYIAPLLTIGYLYGRIGRCMWKRRPVGQASHNELHTYRLRRRLVIFLIVLVAVFAALWGPYFIIQCTQGYLKPDYNPRVTAYLQMMGHANVAVDPILYALFHQKIRKHFIQYLRRAWECLRCHETGSTDQRQIPIRVIAFNVMPRNFTDSNIGNSDHRCGQDPIVNYNGASTSALEGGNVDAIRRLERSSGIGETSSSASYQELILRISDVRERKSMRDPPKDLVPEVSVLERQVSGSVVCRRRYKEENAIPLHTILDRSASS